MKDLPSLADMPVLMPRIIEFDVAKFRAVNTISVPLDWKGRDKVEVARRLLGQITMNSMERTQCSPVLSTAELQRIRNNVVTRYTNLKNSYSNVGGSLDARGLVAQYDAVFDATEGGSYCYYQSDQQLIDDIVNSAQDANGILHNAFNQYANTFNSNLSPMRAAFGQLQQAANAAINDIAPCLHAYKYFWGLTFDFHLYSGINSTLDNLIADYNGLCAGSNTLFDQGSARVQGNFEAEVKNNNVIYSAFLEAYDEWDKSDGDQGYTAFANQLTPYNNSLTLLSKFVVLDTPENTQIFSDINQHVNKVKAIWKSFPIFRQALASTGFVLDPGTSSRKFYSRQLVLNTAASAGAEFNAKIAPGESLIGTGFSYQHGGAMQPHAGHKDGRECDIFSVYFRVGGANYSEKKSIQMAVFLLNNQVSRLIYTNPAVVSAANSACPANPSAIIGKGHETHMHFDMATA